MSKLFSPISLRKLNLENRIMISPMCQYSAVDGSATDWHLIHLGQLALGGAGILFLEATAVNPAGRITPACLGLYSDANEAALKRVLDSVRENSDMPLAIQLAHAGRKASSATPWDGGQLIPAAQGGWTPLAPSAVAYGESETPPRAMTREEIGRLARDFAVSTERAARLGFAAIELHAAHGYLLHEFLSPLSNRREDEYGGSLDNRMRLPLEVFAAMRAAWPEDKPMGVRISATDWVEGGWDLQQTLVLANRLKELGCDFIDASSGGNSPKQKIVLGPGYQLPFAEAIRRETGMTTIAVGLITEAQQAEDIIAGGKADMVALARGMLYDPHWAWHAAAALGGTVRPPRQYARSAPREHQQVFAGVRIGMR